MTKHTRTAETEVYDRESYQPRESIGSLISRVRGNMLGALDEALAADEHLAVLGVTASQFVVIASLAQTDEARSASELCKVISYDAGAMTRMIDRLEAKGLIRRERCEDDRRLVYLQLTEAGRAAYPRMRELSRRVQNRFLSAIGKIEALELEKQLRRLLEQS
ncbi:MAG TPA: MarR family transcriptional regulator [Steroidobacteraceae bacterium]|nr:MarR family transcriptional regulator [Steroidobacteraceae bacterium]